MDFNFKFSEKEANIILGSLAKQPFESVAELIQSIQKQASEQASEKEPEVKSKK